MHFLQLLEIPDLRSLYKTLNNKKTFNDKVKAEPFFWFWWRSFQTWRQRKVLEDISSAFWVSRCLGNIPRNAIFVMWNIFWGNPIMLIRKPKNCIVHLHFIDSEIIMLFFWGGRVLLKVLIKRTNAILFSYL